MNKSMDGFNSPESNAAKKLRLVNKTVEMITVMKKDFESGIVPRAEINFIVDYLNFLNESLIAIQPDSLYLVETRLNTLVQELEKYETLPISYDEKEREGISIEVLLKGMVPVFAKRSFRIAPLALRPIYHDTAPENGPSWFPALLDWAKRMSGKNPDTESSLVLDQQGAVVSAKFLLSNIGGLGDTLLSEFDFDLLQYSSSIEFEVTIKPVPTPGDTFNTILSVRLVAKPDTDPELGSVINNYPAIELGVWDTQKQFVPTS